MEHRGPDLLPPPVEAEAARDHRWATVALAAIIGLGALVVASPIFGIDTVMAGAIPVVLICAGGAVFTTRKGVATRSEALGKATLGIFLGVGTAVGASVALSAAAFVALWVVCMAVGDMPI